MAVDLIDPRRDVPTWQWANGSLRPKEITNPVFMEKFTGLTQVHPTELKFFTGNLLDKDDLQGFHTNYDSEKADLVTMSTMLYQLNKSDRDTMLAIAQDLLTDEGLLVVKDFVYVQPNNLRSPRFYRKWHEPGRYRMLVFDKTDPQGNYAELYRAQDSRNLVLAAGCGKLAVRNQTLGFNQLIESA